jgi:hypothetical protein
VAAAHSGDTTPLVAVPHTTLCMGVDSSTEENRSPLRVGTYVSLDTLSASIGAIDHPIWGQARGT